jgi:hypothetical protein
MCGSSGILYKWNIRHGKFQNFRERAGTICSRAQYPHNMDFNHPEFGAISHIEIRNPAWFVIGYI